MIIMIIMIIIMMIQDPHRQFAADFLSDSFSTKAVEGGIHVGFHVFGISPLTRKVPADPQNPGPDSCR